MGISGAQSAVQISASFITQITGGFSFLRDASNFPLHTQFSACMTLQGRMKLLWRQKVALFLTKEIIFVQHIASCFHYSSPPTCCISISLHDILMHLGLSETTKTNRPDLLFLYWRSVTVKGKLHFYLANSSPSAKPIVSQDTRWRGVQHSDAHTHTYIKSHKIHLVVETNEKGKALKIRIRFCFPVLLKPCFNVIKTTPTAKKLGIINREVVCMYHNASFRH